MDARLVRINGLLVLLVALLSLTHATNAIDTILPAQQPDAVQQVREYYLDLNNFLRSGDMEPLVESLAADAVVAAPQSGLLGAEGGLPEYLLALRSSCEGLNYTVQHLESNGNFVSASVSSNCRIASDGSVNRELATTTEMFQANGGKIDRIWSTVARSLTYSADWLPTEMRLDSPGRLIVARMVVQPQADHFQPIPGPAILAVQSGQLELIGNGLVGVVDLAAGELNTLAPGGAFTAQAGHILVIPRGRTVVQNTSESAADLLFAGFASQTSMGEIESAIGVSGNDGDLAAALLSQPGMTVTLASLAVTPLAVASTDTLQGRVQVELQWIVIPPGEGIPGPGEASGIIVPISGAVSITNPAKSDANLQNAGDTPALLLRVATHS